VAVADTTADSDMDTDAEEVEEPVSHKRRGIRLKQDLN
jgi:hypothetical protein